MEFRNGVKTGLRIASSIGGCVLTGAVGGLIIAAVPYAAPLVLCEKLATGMIAGKIAEVAGEQSDELVDAMFELGDDFKGVWDECKQEAENR